MYVIKYIGLIFILFFSINSNAISFFKSCDEKWRDAWAECDDVNNTQCTYLAKRFQPDCKPEDLYLRQFRDGRDGNERFLKRQEKALNNRIDGAVVENYVFERTNNLSVNGYASFSPKDSIKISTTVTNRGETLLQTVKLHCDLSLNGNTRLFKGFAFLFPNLIPNGRGILDIYFPTPSFFNNYASGWKYRKDQRDILISIGETTIDKITGGCRVVDAEYEFDVERFLNK